MTQAEHQTRRQILARLFERLRSMQENGCWQCLDCGAIYDWEASDQGQPNRCNSCGSHRLKHHEPTA